MGRNGSRVRRRKLAVKKEARKTKKEEKRATFHGVDSAMRSAPSSFSFSSGVRPKRAGQRAKHVSSSSGRAHSTEAGVSAPSLEQTASLFLSDLADPAPTLNSSHESIKAKATSSGVASLDARKKRLHDVKGAAKSKGKQHIIASVEAPLARAESSVEGVPSSATRRPIQLPVPLEDGGDAEDVQFAREVLQRTSNFLAHLAPSKQRRFWSYRDAAKGAEKTTPTTTGRTDDGAVIALKGTSRSAVTSSAASKPVRSTPAASSSTHARKQTPRGGYHNNDHEDNSGTDDDDDDSDSQSSASSSEPSWIVESDDEFEEEEDEEGELLDTDSYDTSEGEATEKNVKGGNVKSSQQPTAGNGGPSTATRQRGGRLFTGDEELWDD